MGSEVRWWRYAALMAFVVVLGGGVALLVSGGDDAPSVGFPLFPHLGVLATADLGETQCRSDHGLMGVCVSAV